MAVLLCPAAVVQLVKNTTRLCDHILSGGCLLIKSPDVSGGTQLGLQRRTWEACLLLHMELACKALRSCTRGNT